MMIRNFLAVALCSIAVLSVACGDDDDNTNTSGTSSGTNASSGTSGNNSSGNNTSSGSNGSGFKDCSAQSSGGNNCTPAETEAYSKCVTDKCDSGYKECFGNDYKSGTFTGVCGAYITCTQKCGCNDTSCFLACGQPDAGCLSCLEKTSTCSDSCVEPECLKAGSSSGNTATKTCAELGACCTGLPEGQGKTTCTQLAGSGQEAACGAAYSFVGCK